MIELIYKKNRRMLNPIQVTILRRFLNNITIINVFKFLSILLTGNKGQVLIQPERLNPETRKGCDSLNITENVMR